VITPAELLARIIERRRPFLAVAAATWGLVVLQDMADQAKDEMTEGEEQLAEMQATYDGLQAKVATLRAGADRLEAAILDRMTTDPALDAGWLGEVLTEVLGEPEPEVAAGQEDSADPEPELAAAGG
jgi:hypothetical protein